MSGSCETKAYFFGTLISCTQPSSGRFRRTCRCNHSREGELCAAHAADVKGGGCLTCWTELPLGGRHQCPITLELVPAVTP